MSMSWIVRIFVHRPIVLLISMAIVSILSIIIPFCNKRFLNFSDPTMGFETRGTSIAQRVTVWKNFYEETRPSGSLTGNPHEYLTYLNHTNKIIGLESNFRSNRTGVIGKRKRKPKNGKRKKVTSQTHGTIITQEKDNKSRTDKSHDNWLRLHNLLRNEPDGDDKSMYMEMERGKYFCGLPDDNYVQFVIKSDDHEDIFNLEALFKICRIETELMKVELYTELCVENDKRGLSCCRPWSLPNYVALLNFRPNCLALTEDDVNKTLTLLRECAVYYHQDLLDPICFDMTTDNECMSVPAKCREYDAVYIILNYLTSITFLPKEVKNNTKLEETMIFLPMARSVATLPFYTEIEKIQLNYRGISVVAMEFGAKNELFDEILIRDTRLMIFGGCFVVICMWIYTCSIFLTTMTVLAIGFSLGISYFVYFYVYNLEFFPFMNMLSVVVIIGIGADDAFIFCKMWHTMKANNPNNTLSQTMTSTLYHALISMFVTSITTAIAFLASYLSSITAIRCFGLFSGTAIIMNYLLMITWLPASVIVWEKHPGLRCIYFGDLRRRCLAHWTSIEIWREQFEQLQTGSKCLDDFLKQPEKSLIHFIIRFKYMLLVVFTIMAVISSLIVFYYPKLEIQHTNDLQLFEKGHLFEQYDMIYKYKFAFKDASKLEDPAFLRFPMRFIWGILPVDNGDYLNPKSLGNLVLDETFNISDPDAQIWLLKFCRNLQKQPFYQPTQGALLTNCFIETFIKWMTTRPCIDPIDNTISRFPCCNETTFPYDADVFDTCIIDAQNDLHQTPPVYLIPNTAGLQFLKSDSPIAVALVVEYDSNYTYLSPYNEVSVFVNLVETWLQAQLKDAPEGMSGGFFVSDLNFFDLQYALPWNTILAVSISMSVALIVLFCATLNITVTILAVFAITCSIISILAVLVLLGWKLNILESVAISSTIGFTVDYCLHYAVNYKLCPNAGENRERATRVALSHMMGPTAMGAITTGAAGLFMMLSDILAYKQIGQFLVVVTSISWLFATFQLGSMLSIAGPENEFGQFKLRCSKFSIILRKYRERQRQEKQNKNKNDPNETESLAVRYDNIECKESDGTSEGAGVHKYEGVGALLNQSPSNSAITFITTEDN